MINRKKLASIIMIVMLAISSMNSTVYASPVQEETMEITPEDRVEDADSASNDIGNQDNLEQTSENNNIEEDSVQDEPVDVALAPTRISHGSGPEDEFEADDLVGDPELEVIQSEGNTSGGTTSGIGMGFSFIKSFDDGDEEESYFYGSGTKEDPWLIGADVEEDDVKAYIDGTTLVITGTGEMQTYYDAGRTDLFPREWQDHDEITSLRVESGITKTGGYAFANMENLQTVVFEGKKTVVSAGAFQNCKKLSDVTLPSGMTKVNGSSFASCTSLKKIDLPATVTNIDVSAFRFAALEDIKLSEKITTIGANSFEGNNLTEVNILGKVRTFGNNAFRGCRKLKKVTIPEGVKKIPAGAFAYDAELTYIEIPKTVTSIEISALQKYLKTGKELLLDELGEEFKEQVLKYWGVKGWNEFEAWANQALHDQMKSMDIHYNGKRAEWDAIYKDDQNDGLTKCVLYYQWHIDSQDEFLDIIKECGEGNEFGTTDFFLETDVTFPKEMYDMTGKMKYGGNFKGTFDGQNHTISHLYMCYHKAKNNIGLFETLKDGAVIRNLNLEDSNVLNLDENKAGVGIGTLAGNVEGNVTLENIHIKNGTVKGVQWVGGIIGGIRSGSVTMNNCSYIGEVTANVAHAGGLIGVSVSAKPQTITNCSHDGYIFARGDGGGIIGWLGNDSDNPTHTVTGCSNKGQMFVHSVSSYGGFAGGIIGGLRSNSLRHEVSGNINEAPIELENEDSKQFHAGGIVGFVSGGGVFNDNENTQKVTAMNGNAGGIVGNMYWGPGTFDSCKNSGEIHSTCNAGGILAIGYDCDKDPAYIFTNNENSGDIYGGVGDTGGIIGKLRSDNFYHFICYNYNYGRIENTQNETGGIIGYMCGGSEYCSHNENYGDVISQRDAGGIIGGSEDDPLTLRLNVNRGSIQGKNKAGGIIGYAGDYERDRLHTIIDNVNEGKVLSENNDAGGIVGGLSSDNQSHVVQNNRNSGDVTGCRMTGGIIGWMVGGCKDMKDNQNSGNIESTTLCAGGIIGGVEDDPVNYSNSKNEGTITAKEQYGDICGKDGYRRGKAINSYIDYASVFGGGSIWILFSGVVVILATFVHIKKRKGGKEDAKIE